MSSVHPSTAPTTAIGDYLVSHEIGRGSFATVYMGKAISTGRPVAVKSVSRDKLNRKLAENLESEIKILKGIQHDHVVALLDIVSTEKHIHLIMEYCSLGDLSHYIKRRGLVGGATVEGGQWNPLSGPWGGLNEIVVRHFLRQLASAMEFLRAHNLIHRDLKPQNVLLCPAPADATNIQIPSPSQPGLLASVPALPVLKLADFGFARALPSHSLASTLCGSPLYMAPEILRGDKYGPSADLWSFGAILYEMICGRPPFKAQNYIDLLRKIERGEGIIRFPGEDMASLTARRSSALSSSPSSRLGTSPGSNSPRFPPNMKGVPPIGEDLKDLIRRLLKRNPAERMPFEAFFSHSCVISNRGIGTPPIGSFNSMDGGLNMLRRKSSTGSQRSTSYGTPPQGDLPFAHVTQGAAAASTAVGTVSEGFVKMEHIGNPVLLPPPGLTRVHTSPARPGFKRGETLVLGMPHDVGHNRGSSAAGVQEKGSSGYAPASAAHPDQLLRYATSSSASGHHLAPGMPDMARQSSAPVFHTLQSSSGSGGGSSANARAAQGRPAATTRISSMILEESGKGSAISKGKSRVPTEFADAVEPPFPGYGGVDPVIFAAFSQTPEVKEPLSSSQAEQPNPNGEDGDNIDVEDDYKGDENNSSLSSLGSLELSEGDDPDVYDELVGDGNTNNINTDTGNGRAGVSGGGGESGSVGSGSHPRPLFATDSHGSGNGKSSIEEYVVVEKRVVEVNWLADQVADAVGDDATHSPPGSGYPVGGHAQYSPQQDPHGWRQTPLMSVTPATIAPGTPPSPPSGTSPRPLRLSPKQRSRIFGSLRESTHQFLNPAVAAAVAAASSSSSTSPQSGSTPPAAYLAAATAASGSPTRSATGMAFFQRRASSSSASTTDPQNHPLLTPLNLCALRGHAVQQLADSIFPQSPSEALGCYLLALRCYQTGMEVAKGIWNSVRTSTNSNVASSTISMFMGASMTAASSAAAHAFSSTPAVDLRVLSVGVQWVRERFNECLERAERCQEAEGDERLHHQQDQPHRPRRVEMVVYEGALEVSRRAAVLELSTHQPPASLASSTSSSSTHIAPPAACEDLYRHAILLIEALLTLDEEDDDARHQQHQQHHAGHRDEEDDPHHPRGMTDEDRRVLERFVASLWNRVGAVSNATATAAAPPAAEQ